MKFLATAIFSAATCLAQPGPAFEAAAIKPAAPNDNTGGWHSNAGRLTMRNMTLTQMVGAAWSVRDFQVSGGPKWAETDRFTIDAKAPSEVRDTQMKEMVKNLLQERFQLALRHETRPVPGYALVVAKSGLKIKPAEGTGSESHGQGSNLHAVRVTLGWLAQWLARQLSQPVVDETAVEGSYRFDLEWSRERQKAPAPADDPLGPPSLFTALPEQLGLKLEPRKLPLEFLVIERAERPSEN
jgi:uncharacterized protein (TIGR03435 family)